jgi:hypothetical protein
MLLEGRSSPWRSPTPVRRPAVAPIGSGGQCPADCAGLSALVPVAVGAPPRGRFCFSRSQGAAWPPPDRTTPRHRHAELISWNKGRLCNSI